MGTFSAPAKTVSAKSSSDGLRLTKVGLWFLIFLGIVLLAATNTGNNGLYLVLAMMVGIVATSQVWAARNVAGLEARLEAREEVFAGRPTTLAVELKSGRRLLPHWLLLTGLDPGSEDKAKRPRPKRPLLVPYLGARDEILGRLETTFPRRGRAHLARLHVTSLFPLGFFKKGRRHPVDLELLVYPELLDTPPHLPPPRGGAGGEQASRRSGWGHELLGLRAYRHGDDPRGIHWKQSARTGELIFQEREVDENRRLLIVFDNATGALSTEGRRRFERLVSEAATAALDYLTAGFEVGLLTRDVHLPPTTGRRQRRAILESLALVEPRESADGVLLPRSGTPHLHLGLDPEEVAA